MTKPDAWHRDACGRIALPPVRRRGPHPADVLLWVALFVLALAAFVAIPADAQDGPQARVEAAMLSFVRLAPRHPVHGAAYRHEVARAIVDAAARYGLDPMLLVSMAFLESSLRTDVTGPAGEMGLLQVARQARAYCDGEDLATAHGQAACGAKWLARARNVCGGDIERALTVFACGRCVSSKEKCKRAVKTRMDVWRSLSE